MIEWARTLFPICRSLTGEGTRQTLAFFEKLNPEFERLRFASGDKVFDWQIPKEWNIRNAYIEHESGLRFAEFSENNLHVVGYSVPVDQKLSRTELLDHIYTQPDQPDVIPYVTSYYSEHWGFCLTENQKNLLPEGSYRVSIDSDLSDGHLELSHAVIPGRQDKEIFFSSYVCHPSMANNELSGPVLLNALMRFVKAEFPDSEYTYRFVLVPETIGSIAYLSRFSEDLKENVICGFNLSCVGDERAYSHVESRFGNTLADQALRSAFIGLEDVKTYSFLQRGSDERQYCAPGIDLPLCGFCRSKYGEYPEYHTSADNFEVVTQKGLEGAFDVMKNIITAFELNLYPKNLVLCEPQLGKRNLYPNISQKGGADIVNTRMDFIAYADGKTSLFDICQRIRKPLKLACEEYQILKSHGLIE